MICRKCGGEFEQIYKERICLECRAILDRRQDGVHAAFSRFRVDYDPLSRKLQDGFDMMRNDNDE
jgi:hypothetical protein